MHKRFCLNGHIIGFHPQTQKWELSSHLWTKLNVDVTISPVNIIVAIILFYCQINNKHEVIFPSSASILGLSNLLHINFICCGCSVSSCFHQHVRVCILRIVLRWGVLSFYMVKSTLFQRAKFWFNPERKGRYKILENSPPSPTFAHC